MLLILRSNETSVSLHSLLLYSFRTSSDKSNDPSVATDAAMNHADHFAALAALGCSIRKFDYWPIIRFMSTGLRPVSLLPEALRGKFWKASLESPLLLILAKLSNCSNSSVMLILRSNETSVLLRSLLLYSFLTSSDKSSYPPVATDAAMNHADHFAALAALGCSIRKFDHWPIIRFMSTGLRPVSLLPEALLGKFWKAPLESPLLLVLAKFLPGFATFGQTRVTSMTSIWSVGFFSKKLFRPRIK